MLDTAAAEHSCYLVVKQGLTGVLYDIFCYGLYSYLFKRHIDIVYPFGVERTE